MPAGTFTQGSPADEACRLDDETQFTHTLTRDILVMQTEVTRAMWAGLQAAQPTLMNDPSLEDYSPDVIYPVQMASWSECVLFANLLSVERGLAPVYFIDQALTTPYNGNNYGTYPVYCDFDASGFRLPTEGEWEYFARAGTTGAFSADVETYGPGTCSTCTVGPGPNPALEDVAWTCHSSPNSTQPAALKLPNPWGFYDVHGNVWERCWDKYEPYPVGAQQDYTTVAAGNLGLYRGGSWQYQSRFQRSAVRQADVGRRADAGFRLVRTVVSPAQR